MRWRPTSGGVRPQTQRPCGMPPANDIPALNNIWARDDHQHRHAQRIRLHFRAFPASRTCHHAPQSWREHLRHTARDCATGILRKRRLHHTRRREKRSVLQKQDNFSRRRFCNTHRRDKRQKAVKTRIQSIGIRLSNRAIRFLWADVPLPRRQGWIRKFPCHLASIHVPHALRSIPVAHRPELFPLSDSDQQVHLQCRQANHGPHKWQGPEKASLLNPAPANELCKCLRPVEPKRQ